MSSPIQGVKLTCFRGASRTTDVRFDTKKTLVMLFGENGTGKSTIIDAIDLVANQCVGSLGERSIGQGQQKITFLPTIGKGRSDLAVEVLVGESHRTGRISGRDITITGDGEMPRVRVLRRPQLLKLIEAQPAQRYEALRRFIDVAAVEQCEQALRNAHRAAEAEYDTAARVLSESVQALEELWKREGSPCESAEDWAKGKSRADRDVLESRVSLCNRVLGALNNVRTGRTSLENAESVARSCQSALKQVNVEITALPNLEGEQAVQLIMLLQQAQLVLAPPNAATTCPVCEQSIVVDDVRASIATRMEGMTTYDELAKRRSQAERRLGIAENTRTVAVTQFIQAVRIAASALRELPPSSPASEAVPWNRFDPFLAADTVSSEMLPVAQELASYLEPLISPQETEQQKAQADLHQFNAITTNYERITENRQKAQTLEELVSRMRLALDICEKTRRDFTQAILDEVAGECARLYAIIHPSESLGSPRLRMAPNRQNSIDQDVTFAGYSEVPPQAYFSDSHLDTLGFCVWLAIVKRERPNETVIALDDVFTSVDGVHLTRIMSLLADLAKDFLQVIVATHYRTWRDRYRLHQAPGLTVQLLELQQWSLNRGILIYGTQLAIEELKNTLAKEPFDRQAIASQAGILLEAILDRLTILYQRRLPRNREGVWTLGDLLDSCRKLFKALEVEKPTDGAEPTDGGPASLPPLARVALQPFADAIAAMTFIRNQVGCHFNLGGCDVANPDIRTFATATIDLADTLMCPCCGDVPSRRAGSFFECGCKQSKMMPLEYTS